MRQSLVLAAVISFGWVSAAAAAGAGEPGHDPAGSGSSLGGGAGSETESTTASGGSAADQSGTHDTGIGTDQKLNVGPGAKSTAPVSTDQPDKMSSPD